MPARRSTRASPGKATSRSQAVERPPARAKRRNGNGHSRGSHGNGSGDLKAIIEMLTADHEAVDDLFKKIAQLKKNEDDDRYHLVQEACEALTVHAAIEEELFYPAAREVGEADEEDVIDEAEVEHSHIKELVVELKDMSEDSPLYDAKTRVLGEYVRHHVKEEETKLFPKLKRAKANFSGLYQQMVDRRQKLAGGHAGMDATVLMKLKPRSHPHGRTTR